MQDDIVDRINEKLRRLPSESQERVLSYINELEIEPGSSVGLGLENLWSEIDEIVALVPEDAWDEIPTDGAANHDHYLYGAPKRYP